MGSKINRLATYLSWSIAIILILVPFHALLTTWAGSNFSHLDVWRVWKEILLLAATPLIIWYVWSSKPARQWLKRSWVARLFGVYVLLHLFLGTWALGQHNVNSTALIYALIINLRFIAFFMLCALISLHSDFLKRYWPKILLAPAFLVVAFGLLQKFVLPYDFLGHFGYSPKTIPAYQTVDANLDYRRIQSTLRGANPLGAYLVLIITTLAAVIHSRRVRPTDRWVVPSQGVILVAALVALFFSYSRSAEIGLLIALAALLWISRPRFLRRWWAVIATGLLIVAAGLILLLRFNQSLQDTLFHTSNASKSAQSSNAQRLQSMKNGLRDVVHQPLGGAPGTAGPASFRNVGHQPRIAENYFLQIGQEVGLLGMGLFMAINFLVGRELWFRRQDNLSKMLLVSLIGLTFVNLVSHAWADDTLAYLWWGLAGVAIATPAVASKKQ